MSVPDRLFQASLETVSTDLAIATLLFTAPIGGPTLITGLWMCPAGGGTSNVVRLHHILQVGDEDVAATNANCRGTVSNDASFTLNYCACKIVMNPGDRIMGQLHAGNDVVVTGYGLRPRDA